MLPLGLRRVKQFSFELLASCGLLIDLLPPLPSGREVCVHGSCFSQLLLPALEICFRRVWWLSLELLTSCRFSTVFLPTTSGREVCVRDSCLSRFLNHLCAFAALIDVRLLATGWNQQVNPHWRFPVGVRFYCSMFWKLEIISIIHCWHSFCVQLNRRPSVFQCPKLPCKCVST